MVPSKEERVLEAAQKVFVRYGFRRATMADIAEAAGMSRPALYLIFPSKEEVLAATTTRVFAALLSEIREGLERFATTEEKLIFAFDLWTVRGFELVQASPDAKDLFESSYEFAHAAISQAMADFVALLAAVLEPLIWSQTRVSFSAHQVAEILTHAMLGFKASAQNTRQLRRLIAGLIKIALASLERREEAETLKAASKRR